MIRTTIDYIRRLPEVGEIAKTVDIVVRKRQQMADIAAQIVLIEREAEAAVTRQWSEEEINTAKREQRDADEAEDIGASNGDSSIRRAAMSALAEAGQCVALAHEAVKELCR